MGPVGFQDLVEMVRAGTLTEDDRVRREFSEQWTPAREVIGLFRAAQAPAAEPKPPEPEPAPSGPQAEPYSPEVAAAAPTARRRQWRIPRIGLGAAITAAVVLGVAAIVGYELWSHRKSPIFPESAAKRPRPVDRQTLEAIRASRPKVPSIPGLEEGVATLIPGLEAVEPGFSPCLTLDMKTIVYAAMPDWMTKYDLYIATRDDVSKPFGPPKLIKGCQSRETDAFPTLSPDGLEVIFARSDLRPQFFHAMRETASGEFGKAVLWKIPDYDAFKKEDDAKRQQVFRPQFLDPLHVMFCFQLDPSVRKMMVAQRSQPKSSFGPLQAMPFSNAWLPWFVSANGLRAYYGMEDGLFVAARPNVSATFGEPIKLLEAKVTGPFDGPVWVAPQEDVVFYTSPGPGKKPAQRDSDRKLWMIRF
jgi:hypothetical protein